MPLKRGNPFKQLLCCLGNNSSIAGCSVAAILARPAHLLRHGWLTARAVKSLRSGFTARGFALSRRVWRYNCVTLYV
jgi:hypothetical protein